MLGRKLVCDLGRMSHEIATIATASTIILHCLDQTIWTLVPCFHDMIDNSSSTRLTLTSQLRRRVLRPISPALSLAGHFTSEEANILKKSFKVPKSASPAYIAHGMFATTTDEKDERQGSITRPRTLHRQLEEAAIELPEEMEKAMMMVVRDAKRVMEEQ